VKRGRSQATKDLELDELDISIIRALHADGRRTHKDLASALGTSHVTVRSRLRRMLARDLVRIVPAITPRVTERGLTLMLFLQVDHRSLNELSMHLAAQPDIRLVRLATGRYDLIAEGVFRREEELREFLERVAGLPGVIRIQSSHVLRVVKSELDWLPFAQLPAASDPVGGRGAPDWDDQPTLEVNADNLAVAKIQLVSNWLSALYRGNVDQLLALSTDDVELRNEAGRMKGTTHGKRQLARAARRVVDVYPIVSYKVTGVSDIGDNSISLWIEGLVLEESGQSRPNRRFFRVTIEDNLISSVVIELDGGER
jgi:Lrp/AsnC family transcriptional regulator for asnA, asnC and gidA